MKGWFVGIAKMIPTETCPLNNDKIQEAPSGVCQREAASGQPLQRPRWKSLREASNKMRRGISLLFHALGVFLARHTIEWLNFMQFSPGLFKTIQIVQISLISRKWKTHWTRQRTTMQNSGLSSLKVYPCEIDEVNWDVEPISTRGSKRAPLHQGCWWFEQRF